MTIVTRPATTADPLQPPREAPRTRVLVVDDDEASRYMVERALESLGQRLVLVESGEEALEVAAQHDFAAIVLDIGLPGANGFDVARALKAQARSQHTPLLFVTGQQYTDALADQAYATGASDLLLKPFNPTVLLTKLRVFVDLNLQRQDLEAQRRELLARTEALEESRRFLSESRASLGRTSAERARLYSFFSQAPLAISIFRGPGLVIELANPLACRLWSRPVEQLIGQCFADTLPTEACAATVPVLRQVLATGVPYVGKELPLRFARQEGQAPEEVFFNVVHEPMRDETGQIEGVISVATEVTEGVRARQRAEVVQESLRRGEEELRTLADSIPQAVWTTSAQGALTYANSTLVHYSGLPLEQLMGEGFARLLSPDTREQSLALMARRLGEGEPFECELCWLRLDGAPRWHLVRAVPLKTSSGTVLRWLGTATDVHDLRQSQTEAQRRADFEQQLIGIVSHDLRNPLSAILLGVTTLARREGLDDRSLKSVLRIQSSAERAVRMIRDLLDFTQARLGGGIPLKRRGADLHLVTRSVLEEVEATNPGREVVLRHVGDGQGEWDADRLAQVIQNLVTNALKYSPPDTPVRVEAVGGEGWVRLSVHNHGEPIPSERGASLFEPLQRATSEVDRVGRSVGLGLYIVDQIVRAHGGAVEVRSLAGEGTTFTVQLPRHVDAPAR